MTETPRTTCPAFIARSGTNDLVCFRQEGHPPPWHYDNRGLGAWFRPGSDGRVVVRIGDTAEPGSEEGATPAPSLLPAPIVDAAGSLDLDGLRNLAELLRTELPGALRSSVTALRHARGTVVAEEDTYDVVRRLTDAGEVLRRVAEAFTAAAREADALTEEEAITVHGEDAGIPRASLFVPDGVGQRIAVRAEYGSGKDSWDLASLIGWLAEDQTEDAGVNIEEDGGWTPQIVAGVARDSMQRLLDLGTYTPKVQAVEAVRLRHAERGDDATAALLRQLRTRGERVYRGVKITREPLPKSQRGE